MAKKRIPREVRRKIDRFIKALRKDNISPDSVFLFGSWAKGNARKESDIDLCVISKYFIKKDPWDYLWNKRLEIRDYTIQPIGYAPSDFKDDDPLAWEIKQTGIAVKI